MASNLDTGISVLGSTYRHDVVDEVARLREQDLNSPHGLNPTETIVLSLGEDLLNLAYQAGSAQNTLGGALIRLERDTARARQQFEEGYQVQLTFFAQTVGEAHAAQLRLQTLVGEYQKTAHLWDRLTKALAN